MSARIEQPELAFSWTCPWCGVSEDHESAGVPIGPFIAHPLCAIEIRDGMDADALETEIQRAEMVNRNDQ